MAKTKAKTGRKRKRRSAPAGKASRKPADLAAIRQQITNLVVSQAVAMVRTTMEEAEKGHYAAVKYLFEMIGLYPAATQEEIPGDDSLARTLMRRLGLPEEPMLEIGVTKDCEPPPVVGAEDAVK
jgi:hypothetical protein